MLKVLLEQMKKNPHMGNLPNPGYPGYPGNPGNVGYNNTAYPYPVVLEHIDYHLVCIYQEKDNFRWVVLIEHN